MKTVKYLTINGHGKCVRVTQVPATIKPNEVCIRLNIDIPNSYFDRPSFVVDMTAPEPGEPFFAEADIDAAREAIIQATGMNISLVVAPEEAE